MGVPVLWMSWHDNPSPPQQEATFLDMLQTRDTDCIFELPPAVDYEPDLIHLSPQGSLTVAGELLTAARKCLG